MNRKTMIYSMLGLVIIIGLFLYFNPRPIHETSSRSVPEPARFELDISEGRLVSGSDRLIVLQGQQVILSVISDQPEELHVHGYDLYLQLEPRQRSDLSFDAGIAGRFGIELHTSDREVSVLEVSPY